MKISIPDDYQNIIKELECFKLLSNFEVNIFNDTTNDVEELSKRFSDSDCVVLIRERTRITKELIEKLPKLKLISQTGKVSGNIDVAVCTEKNIAIAEGKGSPVAPAELTWALIMTAMRKLVPAVNKMKNGNWQTNIGDCLEGKTLGIWGFGKIGKRIANYGKAFGTKTLIWGSENSRSEAITSGFSAAESRECFFTNSDVLTIHLRLKPATKHIISFEDLARMKPDSLFVNTSRAELIKPGDLEKALKSGRPGKVALDVFENEPIYDKNYWALKMKNVLCTPHLGYVEKRGYEYYFGMAFQNVVNYFNGNPTNILNPEVLNQ